MEIINSNRLRISITNLRKHWDAPSFLCQHYRSRDHGKWKDEHTFGLHLFGRGVFVKWRPCGKE